MPAVFLRNARVLTMDPLCPAADAVLIRDGRIDLVGRQNALAASARQPRAEDIDLRGRVLIPAFIDAHMHLLAYAARLVSVDCRPEAVRSIADLQGAIRARAASLPAGAWVRAAGYDELALAERRHPTRQDLDAAAPDHPVRLIHRGGHACVLNSRAMAMAGIDGSTPEPPGGYMERDLETGEPAGLLVEMNELVESAVPPLSEIELRTAAEDAARRLVGFGIGFVQDASHTNGIEEWRLIDAYQNDGLLPFEVSMMEGYDHLCELPERSSSGRLRRGPVKVMPRELEHEFHPPKDQLVEMLRRVDAAGRKAALHAVTRRGLGIVLDAYEALGATARGNRIEHCGICSAEDARRIAALGLCVVTQPGFVYGNGDGFLERVPSEDLPDLYPVRRLLEAGVAVAASSDAPVIEPDPIAGLRGAVARRSRSGTPLAPAQAISGHEALSLFTTAAARVLGLERERGRIAPGLAADLVVLNQDPTSNTVDWDTLKVEMTLIGGVVQFSA